MTSNAFEKKNIRLDLYLFYIRIFKSRNLATKFIISNRLRISGQVTQKPHKLISIGDVLSLPIQDYVKILKVVDIPKRRGPFSEALNYYEDITPLKTQENKVNVTPKFKFVERVGRPTKLERRQTDKLMGRD
jgi:ribosome-associated heat shock protein Hsp15|tara:strand:- start:458 stop:853 length:396 start_codon:yes stop_codon:yes gene_type:complete